MALQKDFADPFDTDTVTSYCRVTSISFDFLGQRAVIGVSVWRSADAASANKKPLRTITYVSYADPPVPGLPPFADLIAANQDIYNAMKTAVYELVKTQPELIGSQDV